MASYVPAKKNTAFVVFVALESQAAAGTFKTSPTLAAGDFKVSIDGGALANLATLPTNTPAASAMVKISLSAAEMNGDNITVVCTDAAGAEWYDLVLNIQTSARQIDDLSTLGGTAQTGDAYARLGAPAGASVSADIADVPTVAEFNARTLAAAAYFDPAADTVANVTAVATVTNLTNAPTAGDLTAAMKASVTTAATAATPTAAGVTAGVLLAATQGPVEFVGQVKITANVSGQGALHVRNNDAAGRGVDVLAYDGMTVEGTNRGLRLQGGTNQALKLLSDTAAATIYIEGPTTGGHALHLSAPSDGTPGTVHPSAIYIETGGGFPGIMFDFLNPAPIIKVEGSEQGDWKLDDLIAPSGIRAALGLAAANLDTQIGAIDDFVDTEVAAIKAVTDKVDTALVLDGAVYQFTANALELAPTGGGGSGLTAQQTRDAMMLAPTAGAPAAGSVDAHLDDILEDTGTTLPGLFAASGATVTVISAVDGGRITVYVADTWSFTVTDATLDLSGYETVALSVKRNARQADADALLYLRSDTGLQRIGGAAPVLAGNGTLSKTATSFTALVALAETGGLVAGQYTWWLKGFDTTPAPDTGFTLATGGFVLERAGLQAVA